jgi:hypothetical protein
MLNGILVNAAWIRFKLCLSEQGSGTRKAIEANIWQNFLCDADLLSNLGFGTVTEKLVAQLLYSSTLHQYRFSLPISCRCPCSLPIGKCDLTTDESFLFDIQIEMDCKGYQNSRAFRSSAKSLQRWAFPLFLDTTSIFTQFCRPLQPVLASLSEESKSFRPSLQRIW